VPVGQDSKVRKKCCNSVHLRRTAQLFALNLFKGFRGSSIRLFDLTIQKEEPWFQDQKRVEKTTSMLSVKPKIKNLQSLIC